LGGAHLPTTAFLLSIVFLSALDVFAQGVQTGTIRGTVVDQQDLPLPGVTVTISSPALQGQRTAITAMDGTYAFRALPAGDYEIAFDISSFAALSAASACRSAAAASRT
jgi:hypothetical protein